MQKKRQKRRRHNKSRRYFIPRQVWILVEVLATLLVLHYTHTPVSDLLPLFKLITRW